MSPADKSQVLLPCPFCGDAAFDHAIEPHEHHAHLEGFPPLPPSTGSHVVECSSCSAGLIDETKDAVFAAWNRRAEIAKPEMEAIRNAGAQLSNIAFNWAQKCGYTLTSDDCSMLDKVRKEWDAAAKPHTDREG